MKLQSKIRFADEKTKKEFLNLKNGDDTERELFKSILKAFKDIEKDAFCGIGIRKELIPREYHQKYNITNLWKYNLPRGWRLIYSVSREEIEVISLILEYFDHKQYEERFNYCFAVA